MPRVFYKSHYFTFHAHVLNHLEYLDKQGSLFTGTKKLGCSRHKRRPISSRRPESGGLCSA